MSLVDLGSYKFTNLLGSDQSLNHGLDVGDVRIKSNVTT